MLKTLLKPFASLTLTVILLCFSMVLIYAGTLAQVDTDIWDVQHKYFHSFFTWLPLQDLVPRFTDRPRFIPWSLPFPGGYVIGGLLLVNLLSAHAVRFKFSIKDLWLIPEAILVGICLYAWQNDPREWLMFAAMSIGVMFVVTLFLIHNKRAGVIVIHLGLILLLIGEGITSGAAVESRMQIQEGGYANYSVDIRAAELAIVDRSDANEDHQVVVSYDRLKRAVEKGNRDGEINDPRLPFHIKVDQVMENSQLVEGSTEPSLPAIVDRKGPWTVKPAPSVSGVGSGEVNRPSVFLTLSRDGKSLGSHLYTTVANHGEPIEVDGKTYDVSLRFTRLYKPYTIALTKFSFDRYTGTSIPKNFSSDITLTPSRGQPFPVHISMNFPLRYGGETFYQSGYDPETETATVLQVVRNPGATMPYIAIMISLIGLIMHFGVNLVNFLAKRDLKGSEWALGLLTAVAAAILGLGFYMAGGLIGVGIFGVATIACVIGVFAIRGSLRGARAATVVDAVVIPTSAAGRNRGRKELTEGRYELAPQSRFLTARFLVPLVLLLICLSVVVAQAVQNPISREYDIDAFARLPLSYEGRVQPFDSLARNTLKVLRGRESAVIVEVKDGKEVERTVDPVPWLLDVMCDRPIARKYKVFSIDNLQVKTLLGLNERARFFSVEDIAPKLKEFETAVREAASHQKEGQRAAADPYQTALIDTGNRLHLFKTLIQFDPLLHVVPPDHAGADWQTMVESFKAARAAGQKDPDPVATALDKTLNAYRDQKPADFNREVQAYKRLLDERVPAGADKASYETWFNRFDPFTTALVLYGLVFVLAALSWMGDGTRFLSRAAFWVLIVALLLHTFGLASRIYISARPPVTNLASAAIFVGWGVVIFAIGLELIFRNGIGSVLAAVAGFPTLMIAYRLALEGDTMKVLQAVLDTNIWLATHVVTITLGYAATFLAGLIGIAYVVLGVFTKMLDKRGEGALTTTTLGQKQGATLGKTLGRMMYGITCFALLFSFVGTILGGIWADQSWGRFWGWDPKENGAILIVLCNALFLHARWGGLIKERGMANFAIFGNIVTAWSFFGTNQLGVGLHSYGFVATVVINMIIFMGLMLFFIGCGLLPADSWRSGQELKAQILDDPVPAAKRA